MTGMSRRALVAGAAASLLLGGCRRGAGTGVSDADVRKALDDGGRLTLWTWDPAILQVLQAFQQAYPKVGINIEDNGLQDQEYGPLADAVKAGTGPDLVQIEYYALPQFMAANALADLGPYGAAQLAGSFTPLAWNSVRSAGGVYGLPLDSAPTVLLYNKQLFDKYAVTVPSTWEDYVTAAQRLRASDPKLRLTGHANDAGFTTSMIWQAGGEPYRVDGRQVGVDFLGDAGTRKFAALWQRLIDGKLLAPASPDYDDWFAGLRDGTVASQLVGARSLADFVLDVPAGQGTWRVAPMPQWTAGRADASESGGSCLAVPAAGRNKAIAWAFARFAAVGQGARLRAEYGTFPATTAELGDAALRDKAFPFFGGQQVNRVLADAADHVVPGWTYLPFQAYANKAFRDTAAKAYTGDGTLLDGLKAWQDATTDYGRKQGFTIA